MTRAPFNVFVKFVVDHVQLHGETLWTVYWDGLVVNNCQNILIGSHCHNDSIKSDAFQLISGHIMDLYFLIISNSDPLERACNTSNILPILLPGLTIIEQPLRGTFQELNPILGVIGIKHKKTVKITVLDFLVDKKQFSGCFIFSFKFDSFLKLCFVSVDQISFMACS